MKLFSFLLNLMYLSIVESQMLMGGQHDEHNCVLDGGYQWCEDTQSCVRSWETYCASLDEPGPVIDYPNPVPTPPTPPTPVPSPAPVPLPSPQPVNECFNPCPPAMMCPMPYMPNVENCKLREYNDHCGCQTRCPSYDCRNVGCQTDSDCRSDQFCRPTGNDNYPMVRGRRLQQNVCVGKVGINETCGGYTPPQFQTRCLDSLDCVNTMGPMIADAPGQCKERCQPNERRDVNGNCISPSQNLIPLNCATYFDGCNTCQVVNGEAQICTLMYCFQQQEPYCMNFHRNNQLQLGDICYRFCEDGSQSQVNRRDECPQGSECITQQGLSMISYDSCGNRAYTCKASH